MKRQRARQISPEADTPCGRVMGPDDLVASSTFQSLFANATACLDQGEPVGSWALADWLESQGDMLLADCLRQSLNNPRPVPLPVGHLPAWKPINHFQGGYFGCKGVQPLRTALRAGFPGLALVQVLELSRQNLFGEYLADLIPEGALPALISMNLRGNPLGDPGAMVVARMSPLFGLSHLSLWGCHIQAEGARILALAHGYTRLKTLNLRNNPLELEGVRSLLCSNSLTSVQNLVLQKTGLEDGSLTLPGREPGWPELRNLYLADNRIGSKGVQSLAQSRGLDGLRHLDLRNNLLRSPGAKAIAEGAGWGTLESLDLRGNRIGPGGGRVLGRMTLPHLRELDLRNNLLGKNAGTFLKSSPTVVGKIRVRLDNNPLRARLPLGLRPRQANSLVARTWRRFRDWLGSGSG